MLQRMLHGRIGADVDPLAVGRARLIGDQPVDLRLGNHGRVPRPEMRPVEPDAIGEASRHAAMVGASRAPREMPARVKRLFWIDIFGSLRQIRAVRSRRRALVEEVAVSTRNAVPAMPICDTDGMPVAKPLWRGPAGN